MKLVERADCPFCWKVRLALYQTTSSFDVVDSASQEGINLLQEFSPTGSVPLLIDGAVAVWESAAILEYLQDVTPDATLLNGTPDKRARTRLLQSYSDQQVGAALFPAIQEIRSKPENERDMSLIQLCEQKWHVVQTYLEKQLGNGTWFGEQFGAADCALAARFGVAKAYGFTFDDDAKYLQSWFERVQARPSWRACYPDSFIGLS